MPLIFSALPAAGVDARVLAALAACVTGDVDSAPLLRPQTYFLYLTRPTQRRSRSHSQLGSTCCESCRAALGWRHCYSAASSSPLLAWLLRPAGVKPAQRRIVLPRCGVDFVFVCGWAAAQFLCAIVRATRSLLYSSPGRRVALDLLYTPRSECWFEGRVTGWERRRLVRVTAR